MKIRLLWSSCLLLFAAFTLANCAPEGKPPGVCETNAECEKGERCVRQQCKAYTVPNDAPEAIVGKNQRLRLGSKVSLDGSKSNDPNGDEITFEWSFFKRPDGSKASLEPADGAKPSFTADAEGLYVVQLVVKDKKGLSSTPARVEIDVYGKDQNGDPIASAGSDVAGCVGDKVSLDGSASSDPDGDQLTFKWSFKTKPEGSAATLDNPDADKPTFTPDKAGKYILALVVTDGLESSPEDTVSVEALVDCKLKPSLTSVTPTEGYIDARLTVKLEGEGFSERATVLFNGSALSEGDVTFVSPTTLEAVVSLSGLIAKDYPIKVRNPNKQESNELQITVKELPTPSLTKLTPATGVSGSKMDIKVEGSGFIKGSEALFNLVPLLTTVVSDTELTFKLDLSQTPPWPLQSQDSKPRRSQLQRA